MTPDQQRIAIAEACGWKPCAAGWIKKDNHPDFPGTLIWPELPDCLSDLNAMHAALRMQTQAFRAEFDRLLHAMAEEKHLLITELEAKDWADCFISCLQSQRDSGNSTP
jgi:hypothetical protein